LSFAKQLRNTVQGRYKSQPLFRTVAGVAAQELLARICRARAALEDVDAALTVASLAKASRMSRSQFIARYRAVFGITPHQTRIRARLDRARWLLATTSLSVTEVCMAVGFASLGSFSRLFRIRCGESPLKFRARLAARPELPSAVTLTPHCVPLMTAAWENESYFSRSPQGGGQLESAS
jgi:transcriptional regulator GlxA family with amidase domain